MNYVKIGDELYDVIVEKITESFNILYGENTGRSIALGARMILEPLGTFYGHTVTFRKRRGKEQEFDRLFNYISKPRYNGIMVEIVHGQSTIKYEAYISEGERALKKIDPITKMIHWDSLTVNMIPMEAQVIPE